MLSLYPLILHPALIISWLARFYPFLSYTTSYTTAILQRRIFVRGWRTKIRPGRMTAWLLV
jgi:hypothetical protein